MFKHCERIKKAQTLKMISEKLLTQKEYWIDYLLQIETLNTAIDEFDKTVRTLESYDKELPILEERVSIGKFRISLPFNNPIYSFVLYSCGIALAGNEVMVRPSKITEQYVKSFFEMFKQEFESIGITLFLGSGKQFINDACKQKEPGGLLFTGKYKNIENIIKRFPIDQHLIYCGQGINPLVIGEEVTDISRIIDIVIESRIYNSGQDCLCSEKIIVHEKVFRIFCERLIEKLDKLKLGNFGDSNADIFPPIKEMQGIVIDRYNSILNEGKELFVKILNGAILAVFEVDINSNALNSEKFSPIFTIAKYNNDSQLYEMTKTDYKFGAIILGGANVDIWKEFPHVVTDKTVMQLESEDSHVPFGGRGKSGFSKYCNYFKDGPILFSVESTKNIKGDK